MEVVLRKEEAYAFETKRRIFSGFKVISEWEGFKKRYFAELGENKVAVEELLEQMGKGPVTFVYSSTERTINNAEALKIYLEAKGAAKS